MVQLNRQGFENRDIAVELRVSGRTVNAHLNHIRIRGVYPGGSPRPSPQRSNPLVTWAVEMAPGFEWIPATATLQATRLEPEDGARFQYPCPIDIGTFAHQVGGGTYHLQLCMGGVTLLESQIHLGATFGPPRVPFDG